MSRREILVERWTLMVQIINLILSVVSCSALIKKEA